MTRGRLAATGVVAGVAAISLGLVSCSDGHEVSPRGEGSVQDDFPDDYCRVATAIAEENRALTTGNRTERLSDQLRRLVQASGPHRDELAPLNRYDSSDGGDERNPGQEAARALMIELLGSECDLDVSIFEVDPSATTTVTTQAVTERVGGQTG